MLGGSQRALSSLHYLVKWWLWKAHLASTAETEVDGVERCWCSCCPSSFHLFSGSKPISHRLFPLTQFTFHVRFIHRLVHPSPLGSALAHMQITTPSLCLCCWGAFSALCCLNGPQNRVKRGPYDSNSASKSLKKRKLTNIYFSFPKHKTSFLQWTLPLTNKISPKVISPEQHQMH